MNDNDKILLAIKVKNAHEQLNHCLTDITALMKRLEVIHKALFSVIETIMPAEFSPKGEPDDDQTH